MNDHESQHSVLSWIAFMPCDTGPFTGQNLPSCYVSPLPELYISGPFGPQDFGHQQQKSWFSLKYEELCNSTSLNICWYIVSIVLSNYNTFIYWRCILCKYIAKWLLGNFLRANRGRQKRLIVCGEMLRSHVSAAWLALRLLISLQLFLTLENTGWCLSELISIKSSRSCSTECRRPRKGRDKSSEEERAKHCLSQRCSGLKSLQRKIVQNWVEMLLCRFALRSSVGKFSALSKLLHQFSNFWWE